MNNAQEPVAPVLTLRGDAVSSVMELVSPTVNHFREGCPQVNWLAAYPFLGGGDTPIIRLGQSLRRAQETLDILAPRGQKFRIVLPEEFEQGAVIVVVRKFTNQKSKAKQPPKRRLSSN